MQDIADSFDRIICYSKGTTSHRIACHIRSLSQGRNIELIETLSNSEITQYRDKVLNAPSSASTVVLTPDILNVEAITRQDSRVRIELALASAPEYTSNIVSALIGADGVVTESRHTEFVHGLLAGISAALQMARAKDPEILAFATRYFSVDASTADAALASAIEYGMFAATLEINRAVWDRTSEGSISYFDSSVIGAAQTQSRSSVAYDAFVSPYRRFWREAATKVSQPLFDRLLRPARRASYTFVDVVEILLLLAVIALLAMQWYSRAPDGGLNVIAGEVALAIATMLTCRLFLKHLTDYATVLTGLAAFSLPFVTFTVLGAQSKVDVFLYGSAMFALFGFPLIFERVRRCFVRKP